MRRSAGEAFVAQAAACVTAQQPIYFSGAANLTGKVQVWRVGNDGNSVVRPFTGTTDAGAPTLGDR